MKLQPLGKRVLVKRKILDKSKGGIILAHKTQEMKMNIGEVIATAMDCDKVIPGDIVTFGKYAWVMLDSFELDMYEVKLPDPSIWEVLQLNEDDILNILVEDAEIKEEIYG
jgi:co-chaperonin GroES (HSP10)